MWQPPFYQFISAVLHYCTTVLHYSLNLLHKWPLSSEPFQKWSKQSSSCGRICQKQGKEEEQHNVNWPLIASFSLPSILLNGVVTSSPGRSDNTWSTTFLGFIVLISVRRSQDGKKTHQKSYDERAGEMLMPVNQINQIYQLRRVCWNHFSFFSIIFSWFWFNLFPSATITINISFLWAFEWWSSEIIHRNTSLVSDDLTWGNPPSF